MNKKLGIIQTRGLGDIVIALPIANHFHKEGWKIYWPVCKEFLPSLENTVTWVNWIPVDADEGAFFYNVPSKLLTDLECDEIICLYQALSSHPEWRDRPEFQITGFDQMKYHIAGIPFLEKWKLTECITRDATREDALKAKLVKGDRPYAVLHLQGSDHRANFDTSIIPSDWQLIEITNQTDCIWDWLSILEGAEVIVAVDSVISNIVDQLGINKTVESYFIPRSHIHLTPVLGNPWTVIDPAEDVKKRIRVFM